LPIFANARRGACVRGTPDTLALSAGGGMELNIPPSCSVKYIEQNYQEYIITLLKQLPVSYSVSIKSVIEIR
jgi:hypothetical protein